VLGEVKPITTIASTELERAGVFEAKEAESCAWGCMGFGLERKNLWRFGQASKV
jgi:hypothetical protein